MRIVVFAFDLPYPPKSGGRVDIWVQMTTLAALGHEIRLICYSDETSYLDLKREARHVGIDYVRVFPFSEKRSRQAGAWEYLNVLTTKFFSPVPSCCTRTRLGPAELAQIRSDFSSWKPDVWLCHGIQSVGGLDQVRALLPGIPWIYRSHNHEYHYYFGLCVAQPWGFKKMALWWQAVRISWYEPRLLRRAGAVLHISLDEQKRFESKGFVRQFWAPPVYAFSSGSPSAGTPSWTVGILSSWFASQKIEGLRWFGEQVMPLLPGGFTVVVAGSGAPAWMAEWCASRKMSFVGQVPSPQDFYAQCAVLANPVLRGAGVNMKTMEMLASGRPVVSTEAGLAGLPAEIASWAHIATNPQGFAKALVEAADAPPRAIPAAVFEPFSADALRATFLLAYAAAQGQES